MVVNAILDFFSVASFLPLIFLIVKPDFISNNKVASGVYDFFGFTTPTSFIVVLTAGVLLFTLAKNLVNSWIANVRIRFAFETAHHLSSRVIADYMTMPFSRFSQTDFSGELNRIVNHPLSFANNIIVPITTLICEICIIAFFLMGMAYYNFTMLLLLGGILLPAIMIYQLRKNNLRKIGQSLKANYKSTLKLALQIVEALPEIKIYGQESSFHQKFQGTNRDLILMSIKDKSLQAATVRLTEIVVGALICLIVIYTVTAHEDYRQTLLLLGVYIGASFRMIPSANRLLYASQQLRMNSHLLDELEVNQNLNSVLSDTFPALTFNHSILVKNVSFQYPDGPVAFSNISFTIRKGEKVAITGNSGEGKTTLLLVLLRLLKETEGQILVDDKLLIDVNGWRKILGYVPQDPYIVDGTLYENIAFGIPAAQIDRSKILQIVHDLDMDDLVRQLPKGLDSRIGERGATLSGGQKQRLAIARALYADAHILLLDEATNQIHGSLESEIMELLARVAGKKKTIIMVTHKVPTNFFDTVYHLEKGRLKEVVMH
jgi:ATP-binding cassette, subfamily B, bacterial PglK